MSFFAALSLLSMSAAATPACPALLDHRFRPLAGKEAVRLCDQYAGQVLLVVNVASKCGYTNQYEGLEAMNGKYQSQGLTVLGFPSNDFMGQEPGTEAEIKEFCTLTYGVKFPMFEKVTVKGDKASPFYQQLSKEGGEPKWNFHKYLIGRDGKLIKAYGSGVKPGDAELIKDIEAALKQK